MWRRMFQNAPLRPPRGTRIRGTRPRLALGFSFFSALPEIPNEAKKASHGLCTHNNMRNACALALSRCIRVAYVHHVHSLPAQPALEVSLPYGCTHPCAPRGRGSRTRPHKPHHPAHLASLPSAPSVYADQRPSSRDPHECVLRSRNRKETVRKVSHIASHRSTDEINMAHNLSHIMKRSAHLLCK